MRSLGRASDLVFVLGVLIAVVAVVKAVLWLVSVAAVLLLVAVGLTLAKRRSARAAKAPRRA